MLRRRDLRTEIFAYDHNWTEHPNDIAATPPDETADINDYPQNVLTSPAAKWTSRASRTTATTATRAR